MPPMRRAALLVVSSLLAFNACKKDGPQATADAAPVVTGTGVAEADVKRVIREAKPMMEKCYAVHVTTAPDFAGKVTLVFAVNPDGSVDKKRLGLGGAEGADTFAKCVLDVVAELKFPAATAATDVQMPVDLGKRADAGVVATPDARGD